MPRSTFSAFFVLAILALAPAAGLRAGVYTLTFTSTFTISPTVTVSPTITLTATPSDTPVPTNSTASDTPTQSPTFTATATVGTGSYTYTLIDASTGQPAGAQALLLGTSATAANIMQINYTVGSPLVDGTLSFYFPPGFDTPSASNFWILPGSLGFLWQGGSGGPQPYAWPTPSSQGSTVTVQVTGVYTGQVISFLYGGSTGFGYQGQPTPQVVQLSANNGPITGTAPPDYWGGQVATPGPLVVWSVTSSPNPTQTATVTPDFSPTPTFTVSPSVSPTMTVSPTSTKVPLGPDKGFYYSFPNPFDMRISPVVTFRFPAAAWASITIYNLLGYPVARIPSSNIFPGGFPGDPLYPSYAVPTGGGATWNGNDDLGEMVAGGLYFAVLKTPSGTQVHKFTVLNGGR